jgi:hypothetical protein
MKRIILVMALLAASGVSAYADTSIWTSTSRPAGSDYDRVAANNYCDREIGAQQNGIPTSAAYKRCMAGRGWKFVKTQRDDTWVNHRGMSCHPILNGFGSECSSF